jgi:uncharacterized membrane protein YfcA
LWSTIAFCFLVGELISLATLAVAGRTSATQFEVALLLVPPLALGAMLSRHVHHRVDGRVLRALVLAFAIVSGAVCFSAESNSSRIDLVRGDSPS